MRHADRAANRHSIACNHNPLSALDLSLELDRGFRPEIRNLPDVDRGLRTRLLKHAVEVRRVLCVDENEQPFPCFSIEYGARQLCIAQVADNKERAAWIALCLPQIIDVGRDDDIRGNAPDPACKGVDHLARERQEMTKSICKTGSIRSTTARPSARQELMRGPPLRRAGDVEIE